MKHQTTGSELAIFFEEDLISTSVQSLFGPCKDLLVETEGLTKVVVDLAKVKMVDSQGLNLLVALYQECKKKNRQYQVTGVSPSLKRLFDFVKMSERFGL